MKISKKGICIFLLVLLSSILLHIFIAKINGLYNSGYSPTHAKFKVISWKEVFQEWKFILYQSIGTVLICYFVYFIAKIDKKKDNEN
jgi:hypothetical protein